VQRHPDHNHIPLRHPAHFECAEAFNSVGPPVKEIAMRISTSLLTPAFTSWTQMFYQSARTSSRWRLPKV